MLSNPTQKNKSKLCSLLASLMLATLVLACGSENKEAHTSDTLATESSATETPTAATATTEIFKDFDWNTVPSSTADIGGFPYLSAPEGMYVQVKDSYTESKTGYSHFKDFGKLIIFNDHSFYNAEGKVAELKFKMRGEDVDWNQYKFDSSVEKYLASIGAKPIGKLKITNAQKDFLNKEDDMNIYHHIVGDPYNEPVRYYALNHAKGKIFFQVFSNSATGEVGVVELEGFQQTIKAPTAAQMKKDILANGRAILNINFDTDKASLKPDGQVVVEEILSLLKSNTELKIAIEGHTDNTGSAEGNKQLSNDRAQTILKSLTASGIAPSRLTAAGFGAERPLVANDSEVNMARNRRVELVKK
ncbi:MAG: OmpA family protein [Sphingobacteriales bacterium]|nr:MAG: OmpA family protein [Sphingobacteriales bacterium]